MLGTAGTLIKNIDFFDNNDGLLIHADNYCEEDLNNLLQAHHHRPTNCIMTMLTFETDKPSQSGIVKTNNHDILRNFYEKTKQPPGNTANGAIYLISSKMLNIIQNKHSKCKDFSKEIIEEFIGQIYCYKTKNFFVDIGDVDSYKKVNEYVTRKSE